MITTSSSIGAGGPTGPDPRRPRAAAAAQPQDAHAPVDHVSTDRADRLREAIAASPAARADEVARAEALAMDPAYPPLQIIERVARLLSDSQDLSEIPD